MFRVLPCSSSGGPRRTAVSGIVTFCRWLSHAPVKNKEFFFLTGAQDSHLQRVTVPEAAYIQLRRRHPEDEQGNARNMQRILINVLYINKKEFCASSWKSIKVRCTVNQPSRFVINVSSWLPWTLRLFISLKRLYLTISRSSSVSTVTGWWVDHRCLVLCRETNCASGLSLRPAQPLIQRVTGFLSRGWGGRSIQLTTYRLVLC
jgi:hypothetical protein